MLYKRRELRRLWEIEVFDGDPEDPNVITHKETLIAWNAVDAIRAVGHAVYQPVALYFITWPDEDGNRFRVNNTTEGPVGDPVEPSIARTDPSEKEWQ